MLYINLKMYRIAAKMTQKEVANELNISYQQYQKYEYEELQPNITKLLKLREIFKIPENIIKQEIMTQFGIYNDIEYKKLLNAYK